MDGGLAGHRAADRAAAEQAVAQLYRRHGRPLLRFVWADSPVSGALIVGLLSGGDHSVPAVSLRAAFADPHWDVIGHQVRDSVFASITAAYGDAPRLIDPMPHGVAFGRYLIFRDGEASDSFRHAAAYFAVIRREPCRDRIIVDHPPFLMLDHQDFSAEWIVSSTDLEGMIHYHPLRSLPVWLRHTLKFVIDDAFRARGRWRAGPATLDLFRRIGLVDYDEEASAVLDLLVTVARSCDWCWSHERVCVLTERPIRRAVESLTDSAGRQWPHLHSHCADGPVAYRDGWSHYRWHGVRVPEKSSPVS